MTVAVPKYRLRDLPHLGSRFACLRRALRARPRIARAPKHARQLSLQHQLDEPADLCSYTGLDAVVPIGTQQYVRRCLRDILRHGVISTVALTTGFGCFD